MRQLRRLYRLIYCFIGLQLLTLISVLGQNSWTDLQKTGKGEVVVYYTDVKPFVYFQGNDSLKGIEYELFEAFIGFVNQKYRLMPKVRYVYLATFNELHEYMKTAPTGAFALSAFSITESRKNYFQFSPPYMPDVEIMVSSENLPVIQDSTEFIQIFQKAKALTLQGTTFESELLKLKKLQPTLRIEYEQKHDYVYDRISQDSNLFSFANLADYLYRSKTRYPMKRQIIFKTEREGLAIVMPRNTDWNEPISAFFASDTFPKVTKKILQKYLGEDVRELVLKMAKEDTQAQEQIALLKEENIINQQKIRFDEDKIEQQSLLNRAFIAFVMILAIFVVISYVAFRVQQSQKKLLAKQNKQIESQRTQLEAQNEALQNREKELQHKNTEIQAKNTAIQKQNQSITDSIRAAQVIQDALLPFQSTLDELFKDHFLLYLPQSIVSGDFFWVSRIENKTFVAVIDCTGHGVPGAFMSMIGQAYLNKIINENHIYEPHHILENFHENVWVNLKQDEIKEHTAYGMDVCMTVIEKDTKDNIKLYFAGAKRPLFYIHKERLHEIRGTRRSIGGRPKKKFTPFKTHEILLNAGDVIYLTTDGYVDNGNPKRQNFGSQQLIKLLQANYAKPLTVQGEILLQALKEHQQDAEQRDDITVLGVRI